MRNYSQAVVTSEEVFESSYETSLAWARSQQAKENKKEHTNVSFTIDGEPGGKGKVTKHMGWVGATPPYQQIVHSAN